MSAIPVPYTSGQTIQGHYACAQQSGATLTIAAAGIIGSLRFPGPGYATLMRVKVGYSVSVAVVTATVMDVKLLKATGFTVDFTTASTAGTPSKMRSIMSPATAVPRICTTAVMTGQTLTADASAFAAATLPTLTATTATGTAVQLPVGFGVPMVPVYEWTGLGQHPVVLSANEGILVELFTAGPITTGAVNYYTQWEWAEGPSF